MKTLCKCVMKSTNVEYRIASSLRVGTPYEKEKIMNLLEHGYKRQISCIVNYLSLYEEKSEVMCAVILDYLPGCRWTIKCFLNTIRPR